MDRFACGLREVKFAPDATTMSFEGYGAVFGNVDAYGDVIQPGAFAGFLSDVKEGKQAWPMMLSQHGGMGITAEDLMPIGVWEHLSEDGNGLYVKGQLADTPRGREVYELMKMSPRAAIDGLSIGYIAKEWTPRTKAEEPRRLLKRVDLVEISVVSRPANTKARVASVKSIDDLADMSEIEGFLCEQLGISKKQVVGLIARIKSLGSGEPVEGQGGSGEPVAEIVGALRHRYTNFVSRS